MTALLAYGLFALLGLVVIVGALLADSRARRKANADLIEEIRAETARTREASIWRKS